MQIIIQWDEEKYYKFANGPWITYPKQFPGFTAGLSLSIVTESRDIVFDFDEKDTRQLMFANTFCKHFDINNPPDVIKQYRSFLSYPARLALALCTYISRKLSRAHIRAGVRELCEEYGLTTMQMALANPPDSQRNPQLGTFIWQSREEIKAWVREKTAKQDRHEKMVFLMEFLILVFVFVEVSDRVVSLVKSWFHFP